MTSPVPAGRIGWLMQKVMGTSYCHAAAMKFTSNFAWDAYEPR